MIFLTVGTQFPFDRLVRAVDEVVTQTGFDERIFAQVGTTSYRPRNFEAVPVLEKTLFDSYLLRANGIISHAGMGTIAVALEHKKPLLVMPRLKKYGEVVNDHQLSMALQFSKLGYFIRKFFCEGNPFPCHACTYEVHFNPCRINSNLLKNRFNESN